VLAIVVEDIPTKIMLKREVAIVWLGGDLELQITDETPPVLHILTSNLKRNCACRSWGWGRGEIGIQNYNEKLFFVFDLG
jgi:hypothetical protein